MLLDVKEAAGAAKEVTRQKWHGVIDTATGNVVNQMVFDDPDSIAHLQAYDQLRHQRDGSAMAHALYPAAVEREVYYASDYGGIWGYDSTFGRLRSEGDGWQFGISVNLADNQSGYDGIHDDKDRTELNLGVAGYQPGEADISSYWPGSCESSCANEDWAFSMDAGAAGLQVWHK